MGRYEGSLLLNKVVTNYAILKHVRTFKRPNPRHTNFIFMKASMLSNQVQKCTFSLHGFQNLNAVILPTGVSSACCAPATLAEHAYRGAHAQRSRESIGTGRKKRACKRSLEVFPLCNFVKLSLQEICLNFLNVCKNSFAN